VVRCFSWIGRDSDSGTEICVKFWGLILKSCFQKSKLQLRAQNFLVRKWTKSSHKLIVGLVANGGHPLPNSNHTTAIPHPLHNDDLQLTLGHLTYVGKQSAADQPTTPTQPFILSRLINWVVSWYRMCAQVAPSGECLRGYGRVRLKLSLSAFFVGGLCPCYPGVWLITTSDRIRSHRTMCANERS